MHGATSLHGEQWLEEGTADDGWPIFRITAVPAGMSYGEGKHMYSPTNSATPTRWRSCSGSGS